MSKKIDFFNRNSKKDSIDISINNKMSKATRVGSKTSKKDQSENKNIVKRRGRRPKKIIENIGLDDPSDEIPTYKNSSAVILKIPFSPSKLRGIKDKTIRHEVDKHEPKHSISTAKDESEDESDKTDESSEGMFRNDIPGDNTCHKCSINEKTISVLKSRLDKYEKKEKIDKSHKIYINKINFISYNTGKKIEIKKTSIKCWWDAHSFTNIPCFLPELFHNDTYHVSGCFCSFNCALAYNLYYLKDSKIHHRKSLIYKLYREMHGLSPDEPIDIKEAPPKEILEDFGGDMSIDTFRKSFITFHKEYIVFIPPIKPISITIEERNVDLSASNANENEYVLRRSKPLTKKRSIISSLKMSVDGDEE